MENTNAKYMNELRKKNNRSLFFFIFLKTKEFFMKEKKSEIKFNLAEYLDFNSKYLKRQKIETTESLEEKLLDSEEEDSEEEDFVFEMTSLYTDDFFLLKNNDTIYGRYINDIKVEESLDGRKEKRNYTLRVNERIFSTYDSQNCGLNWSQVLNCLENCTDYEFTESFFVIVFLLYIALQSPIRENCKDIKVFFNKEDCSYDVFNRKENYWLFSEKLPTFDLKFTAETFLQIFVVLKDLERNYCELDADERSDRSCFFPGNYNFSFKVTILEEAKDLMIQIWFKDSEIWIYFKDILLEIDELNELRACIEEHDKYYQ